LLEKRWEYTETVHQIFLGIKETYDSIRREVLYNIEEGKETTRKTKT
jgi:hypothetical protein